MDDSRKQSLSRVDMDFNKSLRQYQRSSLGRQSFSNKDQVDQSKLLNQIRQQVLDLKKGNQQKCFTNINFMFTDMNYSLRQHIVLQLFTPEEKTSFGRTILQQTDIWILLLVYFDMVHEQKNKYSDHLYKNMLRSMSKYLNEEQQDYVKKKRESNSSRKKHEDNSLSRSFSNLALAGMRKEETKDDNVENTSTTPEFNLAASVLANPSEEIASISSGKQQQMVKSCEIQDNYTFSKLWNEQPQQCGSYITKFPSVNKSDHNVDRNNNQHDSSLDNQFQDKEQNEEQFIQVSESQQFPELNNLHITSQGEQSLNVNDEEQHQQSESSSGALQTESNKQVKKASMKSNKSHKNKKKSSKRDKQKSEDIQKIKELEKELEEYGQKLKEITSKRQQQSGQILRYVIQPSSAELKQMYGQDHVLIPVRTSRRSKPQELPSENDQIIVQGITNELVNQEKDVTSVKVPQKSKNSKDSKSKNYMIFDGIDQQVLDQVVTVQIIEDDINENGYHAMAKIIDGPMKDNYAIIQLKLCDNENVYFEDFNYYSLQIGYHYQQKNPIYINKSGYIVQ